MTDHGPVPRETLDDLLNITQVIFGAKGEVLNLAMPSDRELNATLPLVGGRNLPHTLDEVRQQLERRLWEAIPKWRAAKLGPKTEMKAKPAPSSDLAQFYRPKEERDQGDHGNASIEARVREMTYADLAKLCQANGLSYKLEAPNNGVLVMRARNAVYNALRAGKPITL